MANTNDREDQPLPEGSRKQSTEQYLRELHESGVDLTSGAFIALTPSLSELGPFLTAPVQLPAREQLTVRLMPVNTLDRLEEYKNDEAKFLTILGISQKKIKKK